MPTAPPAEPPLGEEKGRRMRGWGAEPMEVLSPDGQMSGCFTQPHVAGAMCRLSLLSETKATDFFPPLPFTDPVRPLSDPLPPLSDFLMSIQLLMLTRLIPRTLS